MSAFTFTKIAIVQSLEPTEFHSGTELKAYLDGLSGSVPLLPALELVDVTGRASFEAAIEKLILEAETQGQHPILHLELHGWDDKTGLAFPDDSSLGWRDLGVLVARLNKATGFNLFVCVGACFGGHFLGALRPHDASPCFSLLGPTHSIYPSELLGVFRDFYRELLTSLDANAAVRTLQARRLDEGGFLAQTAEHWFFKLVQGYLERDCTRARLVERAARMETELTSEGKSLDSAIVLQLGVQTAIQFLDRAFAEYFMTDAIPENIQRFESSLTEARIRAKQFFAEQGL